MLSKLALETVDLHLPALGAISSQLTSLELEQCRLRTGARQGASTAFFESGWGCLTRLSLERSLIDAPIAGVSMPQLQQLEIGNFVVERGAPSVVRIDTFLDGCPRCCFVQFEPLYSHGSNSSSNCKGLTSLKDVNLAWAARTMFMGGLWPAQPLPHVELPASVTCLKCFSREARYMVCGDIHTEPDLHAMLSMAARCIAAGVPLQTLILEGCTTYTELVEGHEMQPTAEQHALHYRPVCAALHGLKDLDLAGDNPMACSVETVNTVVSSAPDLTALDFKSTGVRVHGTEEVQVQCRGLTQLEITFGLDGMLHRATGSPLLSLELQNAACLQKCVLYLEGEPGVDVGDVVRVVFDTPVMAEVVAGYSSAERHRFRVSALVDGASRALQQAPLRRVNVSAEWGVCSAAEEGVVMGWKVAVQ